MVLIPSCLSQIRERSPQLTYPPLSAVAVKCVVAVVDVVIVDVVLVSVVVGSTCGQREVKWRTRKMVLEREAEDERREVGKY